MTSIGDRPPTLYSYWRSSAAWRKSEEYKKNVHPGGLVPACKLHTKDGHPLILTQSLAIIDYFETIKPTDRPLIPQDPFLRAHVMELVFTLACDTHPLQNLRVLHTYPEAERSARAQQIIAEGLKTFEMLLAKSGRFCVGDQITLADVVLVPQFYNAIRWKVDTSQFPKSNAIYDALNNLAPFIAAHPDNQPDAPPKP